MIEDHEWAAYVACCEGDDDPPSFNEWRVAQQLAKSTSIHMLNNVFRSNALRVATEYVEAQMAAGKDHPLGTFVGVIGEALMPRKTP